MGERNKSYLTSLEGLSRILNSFQSNTISSPIARNDSQMNAFDYVNSKFQINSIHQ